MRETECRNRCADKENACYKRKKNSKTYWFHYIIYIFGKRAAILVFFRLKKSNNNRNAGDKPRSEGKEKTCVNICLHA